MIRPFTKEYYQNRLDAYKAQLKALLIDANYKNHETKRADLKKYYEEQIIRYEKAISKIDKISSKGVNEIAVNGAVQITKIGSEISR